MTSKQQQSAARNRQRLPGNPDKVCASCLTPRRNRRTGWAPITRGAEVVGWTCPDCPTHGEPIRREVRADRVRFVAVVDGTPDADGKRRQLKRRFDRLDVARGWVEETRQGVAASAAGPDAYIDPSVLTVRALADRWLAKRAEEVGTPGGIREITLNGYRSALDAPLRHIGDRIARALIADDVESLLRTLATRGGKWRRGLSHRSIVYALGTLRQVFAYGVRRGWLPTNPAADVRPPHRTHTDHDDSDRQRWSPAELAAFRGHVDGYAVGAVLAAEPWLRAGIRLTLCGLRRSEVLGLDWQRVDLDAGTVKVGASRVKVGRGKLTAIGAVKSPNSGRTVQVESIHPGTVAALRELWLTQGRPVSGLVILNAAGEPVDPDGYSRRFRELCRAAGVPLLGSIHNIRHTIATALDEAGVPDVQAAALLGHDVATYRRFYLVTDATGAAQAAAAAGRLFAV